MADENPPSGETLGMDQRLDTLYANARSLFPEWTWGFLKPYFVSIKVDQCEEPVTLEIMKLCNPQGIYEYAIYLKSIGALNDLSINSAVRFNCSQDGRQHLIQEWVQAGDSGQYREVNYDPHCYHDPEQSLYASEGTPGEARIVGMMEQAMQNALESTSIDDLSRASVFSEN